MSDFSIKSKELIDHTLSLQRINDVALPIAVQNTLNNVAKDVKKRTLDNYANKYFDIKRRTFFKSNSAYKPYKAKQANYNVNRLKAEVGITKGKRANEKATEQVGYQQTATKIKRSINPLGEKPQTKAVIDILSKKPEIYQNEGEFDAGSYIKKVSRAKKRNAPFIRKNTSGSKGSVGIVKTFRRLKSGKLKIKILPIASYIKGGFVKLKKKSPFLNDAAIASMNEKAANEFLKEARKQIERVVKRK